MKNFISSQVSRKPVFLLVAAVAIPILFSLLNYGRAFQVSEAREGVVIQEMIDSGNLILPLRNGHIVPSKPVFFHWIGATVALVHGQVDEFVIRFPSALGALACVLTIVALLANVSTAAVSLMGAAVLLSLNGFVRLAADGRVDMLFCFFVTAAICIWLKEASKAWQESRSVLQLSSSTYLAAAFLCGLAILTKGPLGLVLVGLVISTVAVSLHGAGALRVFLRWEWGLALLLSAPWYLAAAMSGGESFVGRQIFFENIKRFTGAEGITAKPPWFYLYQFPLQAAPWSLVLIYFAYKLIQWRRQSDTWQTVWLTRFSLSAAEMFLLRAAALWAGSMFIFYSLSTGKRSGYLLTLAPAVAIVVALLAAGIWRKLQAINEQERFSLICGRKFFYSGLVLWSFVILLVAAVSIGSYFRFGIDLIQSRSVSQAYQYFAKAVESGPLAVVLFIILALGSLVFWLRAFRLRDVTAAMVAAFLFFELVLSPVVSSAYALKGVTHSYYEFVQEVKQLVPESTKIFFVKTLKDESFDGFFFYFKRHVQYVPPKQKPASSGMYLARQRWFAKLPAEYRAAATIIAKGGRLTDEPGEELLLFQFDATSPASAAGTAADGFDAAAPKNSPLVK